VSAERPSAVGASKPERIAPFYGVALCHEPSCKQPARWLVDFPGFQEYRCTEHKPELAGASMPEPHPKALLAEIRKRPRLWQGGTPIDSVPITYAEVDVLVGRLEQKDEALRQIANREGDAIHNPGAVAREALGVPPPEGETA
jgi:hypothetical protein